MEKQEELTETTSEDILLEELKKIVKSDQNSSWIETFYKSRTDRFIAENNKIWTTGRIFIPISMTLFGVYATRVNPSIEELLVLAAISILLLIIWEMISKTHKEFQTVHEQWLTRIDKVMGVDFKPKKKKRLGLGELRKGLIWCVTIIWGLFILAHPTIQCFLS